MVSAVPLEIEFQPPEIEFDDTMAREFARVANAEPVARLSPVYDLPVRKSPFVDYARILTAQGGILILYTDRARGWLYMLMRIVAWFALTGIGAGLLGMFALPSSAQFLSFLLLCGINLFCVTRPIKIRHSVEIRHDRMILDEKDVFWASDIGTNWPELKPKDDDPSRLVICGICGTRFVEFMTANRMDDNDRTPEVLAADLKSAMEQLWGRSEVIFDL